MKAIKSLRNIRSDLSLTRDALKPIMPNTTTWYLFLMITITLISGSSSIPDIANFFDIWNLHIGIGMFFTVIYFFIFPPTFNLSEKFDAESALSTAVSAKKISDESLMIASCHEAGHALALALLPENLIPDEISLHIKTYESNEVGALSYSYHDNILANIPDYFFWRVAICRAGFLAEKHFKLKETALSKKDRIDAWEAATNFLVLQNVGNYFLNPVNKVEAEINHSLITEFINKMDIIVVDFFNKNSDLLKELSDVLWNKKQLNKVEVLSFVNRAII